MHNQEQLKPPTSELLALTRALADQNVKQESVKNRLRSILATLRGPQSDPATNCVSVCTGAGAQVEDVAIVPALHVVHESHMMLNNDCLDLLTEIELFV